MSIGFNIGGFRMNFYKKEHLQLFLPFFAFVIASLIICNSSYAFKNEPDGFRKIKFGMSFKQVQKIVGKNALIAIPSKDPLEIGSDAVKTSYRLKLDPAKISGIKTDETAVIGFFKDKLSFVKIIIHGDVDKYSENELSEKFNKLENNMRLLYGTPVVDGYCRTWEGTKTNINLYFVTYKEFSALLPEGDYEKMSEEEKENFKNHISLHMRSQELFKESMQWTLDAIKNKRLQNASQGW